MSPVVRVNSQDNEESMMEQQRNKVMERETTKEVESGDKGDREGGGDLTMENQQQIDKETD